MKRSPIKRRGVKPAEKAMKELFRSVVLARDGYKCRKCKRGRPGVVLQCAHIFSVGAHRNMRFTLDNALCMCYRDHIHWAHKEPIAFTRWVEPEIGSRMFRKLEIQAGVTPLPMDLSAVRLELEQALKRLT